MERKKPAAGVPLHRNPRARAAFFQAAAVAALLWAVYSIAQNTAANLEARGIVVGFSWLEKVSPFAVGFSPFVSHKLGETTFWEIFLIAVQNTVYVSVFGIIGATFLGFVIGVMRLSPNWLAAKIASVYVEMFRNVPLLLWFFFWYVAVFLPWLPPLRESLAIGDAVFLNNEGFVFSAPHPQQRRWRVCFCRPACRRFCFCLLPVALGAQAAGFDRLAVSAGARLACPLCPCPAAGVCNLRHAV